MAYTPNFGYQSPQFYPAPMPDQLAQFRQAQQPAMQPMMQMPTPPQAPTGGILWVGSEAEACAYPVPPNSAAQLWNVNEPVVYLKKTDAAGKPSMEIYDLVLRVNAPKTAQERIAFTPEEFASLEALNALASRVDDLSAKIEETSKKGKGEK